MKAKDEGVKYGSNHFQPQHLMRTNGLEINY
jgi:hypothetical protein